MDGGTLYFFEAFFRETELAEISASALATSSSVYGFAGIVVGVVEVA
jgi:hypothetical protein